MYYLLRKIREITKFFVRVIQRILLMIFLTILYFLGFGFTLFLLLFFNRKVLNINKKCNLDPTFWDIAEGYEADINDSIRQS
ncbi:MAG: hypothetical protein PHC37_07370 [Candidatus Omnitrophica bacterium]|nr:hypothetical protein [Candidatus Omnitrophota bacterium]